MRPTQAIAPTRRNRWCAFLLQAPRELSAPLQAIGYASLAWGYWPQHWATMAGTFTAIPAATSSTPVRR
jgi:uncharacterized membrane protein YeiB